MADEYWVFDRFKYAEEHAHHLHEKGHLFRLTNQFAVAHFELGGDEPLIFDEFIVQDLGPA